MSNLDIYQSKYQYYSALNDRAKVIARKFAKGKSISEEILQFIAELYIAAKSQNDFSDDYFETAYHSPITSEFEFFIARFCFHYSIIKKLNWKIYLRRQYKKTPPDIRIERNGKVIAIIEIKVKAGWIQPLHSENRYNHDVIRHENKESDFNQVEFIKKAKNQLI